MSGAADKSGQLAIDGGPKTVTNKLTGWPQFDENAFAPWRPCCDRESELLDRSNGMEFEKKFAAWQGSKYAVSVATGTAALHVCLSALGIGPATR